MAATTTDRDTRRSDGKLKAVKMAAVKIPKGVLVCINTSGYATNGADTASFLFAGVSYEQVDNSAGSAGDKEIRVEKTGEHMFLYNGGDAAQAVLGKEVYVVDNQTVDDDAGATTNDIKCGVIAEVVSGSQVRIRIGNYTR
ncbi:MAG TPA: hypothetical protein VMX94_00875 [Armatimonadota bacterium]|nr:hypothetical protein [Armatimonadota bacterium]